MRFFNTTGPVKPDRHYCLPPLGRLDLDDLLLLIQQQKYFVLHAPRQTGKTSLLLALQDYLNQTGHYHALYFNVEAGQALREDVDRVMLVILNTLILKARQTLGQTFLTDIFHTIRQNEGVSNGLYLLLAAWAKQVEKPIVLFIDEIDTLIGDALIAVLRQLRAGYEQRPQQFPQSIILCGVRDVRDYRIHSSAEKTIITGGSAFNIKAKSLRLGDFNQAEMVALYQQHTTETGQDFTSEALALAWDLHTIAKKGGQSVAYQRRKKAKTSNILAYSDGKGYLIGMGELMAGNHHDAFKLKSHLQKGFKGMKALGLDIAGAYFNADSAFDSQEARQPCFNHGLIPNMPANKRKHQKPKRGRKRLFNEACYKRRFAVERSFAWLDKCKQLLVRFERKDVYWLGAHFLALSLINLRHLLV